MIWVAGATWTIQDPVSSGARDKSLELHYPHDRAFIVLWERVTRPGWRCSTRPLTSHAASG